VNSSSSIPKISVIIPNLNGEKLLPSCLEALTHSTYQDFEVILVDNGSSDHSIAIAKSIIPNIRINSLPSNQGFSGAVQQGITQSQSPYIALLNNDAIPEPQWLGSMLQLMESSSRIGMVACRILNQDGTHIDSLGLGAARNGMAILIGCGRPCDWKSPYSEPFGPSGAAGMYRRDMLNQFGGFPERFFCYYEDLWVAWQGRLRGWHCVLVDIAVVRHLGQGTSFQGWKNRNYWTTLNRWRTIISCWNSSLLFRRAFLLLLWECLIKLGDILSGHLLQGIASRTQAVLELGYWLKIRKTTISQTVVSAREIHMWLIPSPSIWELIRRRFR
jgi:GT2 family glycosyltransferase